MLRLLLLAVVAVCVFEGVRSGMSRLDVRAHNMLRAIQPLPPQALQYVFCCTMGKCVWGRMA